MDALNTSDKYVTVFINPENSLSKQAKAYALAELKFVNIIDVINDTPTTLQILDIVNKCGIDIKILFDQTLPAYQEKIGNSQNFSNEDLAGALVETPELIRTPFVVKNSKFRFYEAVADLAI
jgi:arsenate reductase-like glutaredoxin family protein